MSEITEMLLRSGKEAFGLYRAVLQLLDPDRTRTCADFDLVRGELKEFERWHYQTVREAAAQVIKDHG